MAKVYKFRNRDGETPLTEDELFLIAAFRWAPREVQQRMLELAKGKRKQPEPGRRS